LGAGVARCDGGCRILGGALPCIPEVFRVGSQQISGNPKAVFDVRLDRDGRIQDVRLKQSSGNAAWDSAAERAIRRTDPFPCPRSGARAGTSRTSRTDVPPYSSKRTAFT